MRDYADCAARGLTQAETARELRVSTAAVCRAARLHGLTFVRSPKASRNAAHANGRQPRTEAHKAAISSGLREAWARRPFGGRRLLSNILTVAEHKDYVFLRHAHGYRRAEAMKAIGREDLA
jgi:hypothetical protein